MNFPRSPATAVPRSSWVSVPQLSKPTSALVLPDRLRMLATMTARLQLELSTHRILPASLRTGRVGVLVLIGLGQLLGCSGQQGDKTPGDNSARPEAGVGQNRDASIERPDSAVASNIPNEAGVPSALASAVATGPTTQVPSTMVTSTPEPTVSSAPTTTPSAPASSSAVVMPDPPPEWLPVDDAPEGLNNCIASSKVRDSSCNYRLQCDEQNIWSGCDLASDGTWSCSCYNYSYGFSEFYSLVGADKDTACPAGIPLCNAGAQPAAEPEECEVSSSESSNDYCSRNETCAARTELEFDITAEMQTSSEGSYCYQSPDGYECNCTSGHGVYYVTAPAMDLACDSMIDLCSGRIELGSELECEGANLTVYQNSCSLWRGCGRRTVLDEVSGVSALADVQRTSSDCQTYDGVTNCSCYRPNSGTISLVVETADMQGACVTMDSICTQGAELTLTDDSVVCNSSSTSVSGNSCTTSAGCELAGNIAGTDVAMQGRIDAACSKSQDGEWSCVCSSGDNVSEAFTTTGADGIAACTGAKNSCAASATSIEFGQYGYAQFVFTASAVADAGTP